MTFEELRIALNDGGTVSSRSFELLQEIARKVNDEDTEEQGRDLVLRALDHREEFGPYTEILDALIRQVGLFPYLDPESLSLRDRMAYEFHKPETTDNIVFHRAQAEVYRRLIDGENLILSAPTSFGKSRIIDAIIDSGTHENIAIVVPTIALIDETRRRLSVFGDRYKVITQLAQKPTERNLFIFTAERLVAYERLPHVSFFVIDEFYKLGPKGEHDVNRMVALNQAFYRLSKTGAQFYLLGPSIESIPPRLSEKYPHYFLPTNFATVASDVARVNWKNKIEALVKLTLSLQDPTLIFCKSPNTANEVCRALVAANLGGPTTAMEDAASWVSNEYHPEWVYAAALKRGIGLHHGRLPRSLAQFSVRAFNDGRLKILVCTSTLIEGVNTRAKNVIIYDHLINNRKYDFFTFNNIKGRSGRMSQHFVGRVFLFYPPPTEDLPFVDFPVFTQDEDTPESLLVQIDREDLSPDSKERLQDVFEQNILPVEVIRQNATIDPQSQIDLAKELLQMTRQTARIYMWRGHPTYDELRLTNRLLWKYFIQRPKQDVRSAEQLTFKIWTLSRTSDIRSRILDELGGGEYSAQSPDEAVERVLSFDRNWAGFEFPRLLSACSRIQEHIFRPRFGRAGNYSFFARRSEQLFRHPVLITLEEYGLPLQLGEKIARRIVLDEDLDIALQTIKSASIERFDFDQFEEAIFRDVQESL